MPGPNPVIIVIREWLVKADNLLILLERVGTLEVNGD
jgi:hypothetical protein